MMTHLELALFLALTLSFCRWRMGQQRRRTQSWETLVARFRPDWNARALCDIDAAPHATSNRARPAKTHLQGMRALWNLLRNAGVMLEMADYAAEAFDPALLADLRNDALQLRISALQALASCVFLSPGDAVRIHVLRAESAFAEMELRMTEFLEGNVAGMVPSFVAAL